MHAGPELRGQTRLYRETVACFTTFYVWENTTLWAAAFLYRSNQTSRWFRQGGIHSQAHAVFFLPGMSKVWTYATAAGLMWWLQLGIHFDSTAIRRAFDCLSKSKVIKVTVTSHGLSRRPIYLFRSSGMSSHGSRTAVDSKSSRLVVVTSALLESECWAELLLSMMHHALYRVRQVLVYIHTCQLRK